MTRWLAIVCATWIGGCDSPKKADPEAPASATAAASTASPATKAEAPDACASYVAFLDRCIERLDDDQKPPLVETRDKYKKLVDEGKAAELEQMASSCALGLATTRKDALCKGVD